MDYKTFCKLHNYKMTSTSLSCDTPITPQDHYRTVLAEFQSVLDAYDNKYLAFLKPPEETTVYGNVDGFFDDYLNPDEEDTTHGFETDDFPHRSPTPPPSPITNRDGQEGCIFEDEAELLARGPVEYYDDNGKYIPDDFI